MELRGERVVLRPARDEDAVALLALVREPSVAAWWGPYDEAMVREEMPGSYVILVDGRIGGWLLVEEEEDPMYRHAGLDISLSAELQGRGYGPEALRVVIRHLIACGHHRFTIDPSAGNERAIRAYRSIGFKPVGVMRSYERAADGSWRDGLLMDLLASEFEG